MKIKELDKVDCKEKCVKFLKKLKERTYIDFTPQNIVFRGVRTKETEKHKFGEKCSLSEECGIGNEHSPGRCIDAGLLIKKNSDKGVLVKWNRPFNESIEETYSIYIEVVRELIRKRKKKSVTKLRKLKSVEIKIIKDNPINNMKKEKKDKEEKRLVYMTKDEFRKTCKVRKSTIKEMMEIFVELGKLDKTKKTRRTAFSIKKLNADDETIIIDARNMGKKRQSYVNCPMLKKLGYFDEKNCWCAGTPMKEMAIEVGVEYQYQKFLGKLKLQDKKEVAKIILPDTVAELVTEEVTPIVNEEFKSNPFTKEIIIDDSNTELQKEILAELKSIGGGIKYLVDREKRKEELMYDETQNDISKGITLLFQRFNKEG